MRRFERRGSGSRLGWTAVVVVVAVCGCGSGSPPREARCDQPGLKAAFEACTATKEPESCRAAGGAWIRAGMAGIESCDCPTGQEGCACTRSGHCLAGCYARMRHTERPQDACNGVTHGLCGASSASGSGCMCEFGSTGRADGRCAD